MHRNQITCLKSYKNVLTLNPIFQQTTKNSIPERARVHGNWKLSFLERSMWLETFG